MEISFEFFTFQIDFILQTYIKIGNYFSIQHQIRVTKVVTFPTLVNYILCWLDEEMENSKTLKKNSPETSSISNMKQRNEEKSLER